MLCQRCGNKEGTIQITNVHNGTKTVEYICPDCAAQLTNSNLNFLFNNMASPWQMLNNFLGHSAKSQISGGYDHVCPSCGTSYHDFAKRGRFGCDECYDAFSEELSPIFDKLHFSHEYRGKIPDSTGAMSVEDRLSILTRQMKEAAAAEDYERAGELKKEIMALKRECGGKD